MKSSHLLLLALFLSPTLVLTLLVVLIAVLGWGVLWVIGGASAVFVALSLLRDAVRNHLP